MKKTVSVVRFCVAYLSFFLDEPIPMVPNGSTPGDRNTRTWLIALRASTDIAWRRYSEFYAQKKANTPPSTKLTPFKNFMASLDASELPLGPASTTNHFGVKSRATLVQHLQQQRGRKRQRSAPTAAPIGRQLTAEGGEGADEEGEDNSVGSVADV